MVSPNYSKIAKKQDLIADILAENLIIRTREIVEDEFTNGKSRIGLSYLKEAIEMCFWRGFYEGSLDAGDEIKQPKSKAKGAANFSLGNFSHQILFTKKEDEARLEARKKELDAFIERNKTKGAIRSIGSVQNNLANELKAAEAERRQIEKTLTTPARRAKAAKAPITKSNINDVVATGPKKVRVNLTGRSRNQDVFEYLPDETNFDPKTAKGQGRHVKQRRLGESLTETENWFDWSRLEEDPYAGLSDAERLAVTKNREMFVTLNTRYPALFEDNSFFRTYLDARSTILAENLKGRYEDEVKQLITNYSKESLSTTPKQPRNPEVVLKEIRRIIGSKSESAKVDQAIKIMMDKQQGLRVTNRQFLADYERNSGITQGIKTGQSLSKAEQRRLLKEQDDLFDNVIDSDTATAKEKQAARNRRKEIDDILSAPEKVVDVDNYFIDGKPLSRAQLERYLKLKERAELNPNERRYLDKSRKPEFSKSELLVLRKTLGKDLYDKYVNRGKDKQGLENKDLVEVEKLLRAKGLKVDNKVRSRALTLATTEVSAAYNMGRLQVYLKTGVRYVQFTATLDARTSAFCQSLHRKIYPLEELLVQSIGRQAFPDSDSPEFSPENRKYSSTSGITFWVPPCHPRCRSFLLPIYTDEDRKSEKFRIAAPQSLALDPSLDRVSMNSIFERKLGRSLSDKELREIMKKQRQRRSKKIDDLEGEVNDFSSLFRSGLRLLLNKIRSSDNEDNPELVTLTMPEVTKDDRKLVTALLGAGAVLGFGSMVYFFLKSNLGHSLKEYLKAKTADLFGNSVIAGMTNKQAADIVEGTLEGLKDVPESMVLDLVKRPPSAINLDDATVMALAQNAKNKGNLALEMLLDGSDSSEIVQALVSNEEISFNPKLAKGKTQQTIMQASIRSRVEDLRPSYDDIMSRALTNSAESIDPSNIKYIGIQANTYQVVKKKGSPTFIGKRQFDSVVNNPADKTELKRIKNSVDERLQALSRFEREIDADEITARAMLVKERSELLNMRKLIRNTELKVFSGPRKIDLSDSEEFRALASELRPQIQDMLEETVNTETLYREVANAVKQDFESKLPTPQLINSFVPETEEVVGFLKSMNKDVNRSLADLRKTYLDKNNKPLTLRTASRNFAEGSTEELRKRALEAEGLISQLESRGITYGKNIPEIDKQFVIDVQAKYNELIDLKNRISNRIKELEQ